MQDFDFVRLDKEMVECEECGWSGIGYETEKGYASLPDAIEIFCPVCANYLGQVRRGMGRSGPNGEPSGEDMRNY